MIGDPRMFTSLDEEVDGQARITFGDNSKGNVKGRWTVIGACGPYNLGGSATITGHILCATTINNPMTSTGLVVHLHTRDQACLGTQTC